MVVPVSKNTFGVDTAFPPYPQQPPQGYPALPPLGAPPGSPPPPRQLVERRRNPRRWPLIVVAGVVGAVVASVVAVGVSLHFRTTAAPQPASGAPTVTVSAPAPTSAPPSPLPVSEADHQTCATRAEASRLISEASTAQGVIPEGMTISDPAVQGNPDWKAGAQKAGSLYEQASRVLQVTPGTTPVLGEAITAASKALRALGTSYSTFDAANGNAYDIARQASDMMDVLCGRLAP